ncbi:RNA-binding S4 domain-containing protein [Thiosulfatihalobacter marinus]|uniref:RNA-binding S4 domain-containing protein n=1 Tax=Thiosulfatihalobacter marinus TaxID=2792481 RepID=UPI0018D8F909
MSDAAPRQRLDKWLWQARFFKTRTLAARVVTGGHVRVNSNKVGKASHGVTVGDVLTFPQARRVRVVRVTALGERRGPASEAQGLYADLAPEEEHVPQSPGMRENGRPTKRDRRNLVSLRASRLED